MTKEMTHGSPMKLILGFTIPLLFGNLFQQFYSMVDTIIVGRVLGTGPLAAVGSTGSVTFLIIGFCLGLCSGFAIPVAQRFGSRDYDELRRFIGNAVWLCVGFGALLTLLTVVFCRNILELMGTPADILDDAYAYLVIIFAGIPATFLYNMLAGIQRALGDSRTPVVFLVIASVINIVLDVVLIVLIPLGVAGAALATVVSQLAAGLACLVYASRHYEVLRMSRDDFKLRAPYVRRLIGMGLPMALQTSITAIGSVILQASVNSLGSQAVASVTAGSKLYMFFACAYDAMGVTMSTYSGQNIGARKIDRIGQGVKACGVVGIVYSVLALLVIVFFGKWLLLLFVDASETAILAAAYQYLLTSGLFLIPLTYVNVLRLTIQGMGYSRLAMFAGVFEMVARGGTGALLVPAFGFAAACFAGPIAWLMADSFLIPAYFHVIRRARRGEGLY
ncbi:MATE family efflux transporter [Anaeromassilibacillus senegalensis]|uniref:MATE family efflux transporter n=1 Tax=Anaeromassilibacillus senegalensis TaxID=1673717 RepID=A0ABS9CMF2_9FIRM|nr:MATE family efflux transporter [Anaeromassilibacillus senegalensis]MCF2652333.1 MATE family efflux transporter [Anaeromassilibacillus senegalensis]